MWCFLHILNLAAQAAIEVYDPSRRKLAQKIVLVSEEDFSDFSGSENSEDPDDPSFEDDVLDAEEAEEGDTEDIYSEELKDIITESNAIDNVILYDLL